MKKSTDLKNKITYSNYLLGKVFVLLLSVLIFVLIYKDSFHSFNFYSALALLFLLSTVFYKSYNFATAVQKNLSLIDSIEFSLLFTLIFEILVNIFGNELFPLSYIIVPLLILYFGWLGGGVSFLIIAILQTTQYRGDDLPVQILLLILSAAIFGFLLKGNKELLRSYIFQKNKIKRVILPSVLSGNAESIEKDESQNVKELKDDIRTSLEILNELVPNHSIVLYMKMDDGLYAITDFISETKDFIDRGQRLSFRGGYLGWVLKTKTQVLITSIKNVRKNLVYYNKHVPVKSLLATPLFLKGEKRLPEDEQTVFGMMVVDSLDRDAFGEREKLIVSLISDRIVEIIDRFQLSEKVYLSSQELNSFYEFTQKLNSTGEIELILDHILDTLERLFEADFVGISLMDMEKEFSYVKRVSGGMKEHLEDKEVSHEDALIGLVSESGKYFHFDDLTTRAKYRNVFGKEVDFALGIKNIKSILIYPLYETFPDVEDEDHEVFGCVVMGRKTKNPFNEGEVSLAKIICHESAKSITASLNFQKVKELAIKDGLTGLYNHRHFQEMLSYTIAHAERFSEQASLLFVDVDDLKVINDTYGHQAGDAVISSIGKLLSESLRKVDIPSRYGGDEFAVVLPSTNKDGSIAVAQKIRNKLKGIPFKSDGELTEITLSMGISTYPQNATEKSTLIEKADRALYESKREGKNKITHCDDMSLEELGS